MPLRIANFKKVSIDEFRNTMFELKPDITDKEISEIYDRIELPKRSTAGSAGYDFKAPFEFTLSNRESVVIPTGIRCEMIEEYALFIMPRSGLGFNHRTMLDNTIGLIDADYAFADNEGHIKIKLHSDYEDELIIPQGKAFAQGVFLPYGITFDDNAHGIRKNGFGSTDIT